MDIVGWTVVVAVAVLLYKVSWWFRAGAKWAVGIGTVLALAVYAVYPDILDALPGIANALWRS